MCRIPARPDHANWVADTVPTGEHYCKIGRHQEDEICRKKDPHTRCQDLPNRGPPNSFKEDNHSPYNHGVYGNRPYSVNSRGGRPFVKKTSSHTTNHRGRGRGTAYDQETIGSEEQRIPGGVQSQIEEIYGIDGIHSFGDSHIFLPLQET